MPFTDNCDIYFAIYDAGINRVIGEVMQQRPSLFNYGTALFENNPQLLCANIDAAPEVLAAGNPLITVMGPVPVFGTPYGLNFCAQFTQGQIDFYPGNIISLPPGLNPPLPAQSLALHFRVCAGLGCPSGGKTFPGVSNRGPIRGVGAKRLMASNLGVASSQGRVLANPTIGNAQNNNDNNNQPITVLPTQDIDCFCLDLYATGGCRITGMPGNQNLLPSVSGIDILQLQPIGMEKSLECYALVALNDGLLPNIGQSISKLAFGLIDLPDGMGDLQVSASTAVPNNPAIQDDQLEVFIDLDKVDLNITLGSGSGSSGSGGSGGSGGTVTRTTRGRTRTGTFDVTAAVSADAFAKVFGAFVNGFKFAKSGSGSFGPFEVSYSVAAHLEGGSIQLLPTGGVEVKDVEVKWDTLSLTIGFNIPKVCTPSFCLVGIPLDGCLVEVPAECLFAADPDFSVSIDLGGFIDSKATFTGIPKVYYGVGSGVPNRWQIAVVPTLPIYVEVIDIADTAADLFNTLVVSAIDSLISGLPGWAQDLVNAVLGDVDDIIRTVLGIPDDIGEWFVDMISNLGIFQDLIDALSQYIAITVFEVQDPYTIMPADGPLIPVNLPIQYIGITVNTSEMVLQADVGA